MELIVKGSFYRDVSTINDKRLLSAINEVVFESIKVSSFRMISNIKKLKNYQTLYRIKVEEDYRIGVVIRKNKI